MDETSDNKRNVFSKNMASFLDSLVKVVSFCDSHDTFMASINHSQAKVKIDENESMEITNQFQLEFDKIQHISKTSMSCRSDAEDEVQLMIKEKNSSMSDELDNLVINTESYFDPDICRKIIEACRHPLNLTNRMNNQYPSLDQLINENIFQQRQNETSRLSDKSKSFNDEVSSNVIGKHTVEFEAIDSNEQPTINISNSFVPEGNANDMVRQGLPLTLDKTKFVHNFLVNPLLDDVKARSIIMKFMKKHYNVFKSFREEYSVFEREIIAAYFAQVDYKASNLNEIKKYIENKQQQLADLNYNFYDKLDGKNETIRESYDNACKNLLIDILRMISTNIYFFGNSEHEFEQKVSKDLIRVQNDSARINDVVARIGYICHEVLKITRNSEF